MRKILHRKEAQNLGATRESEQSPEDQREPRKNLPAEAMGAPAGAGVQSGQSQAGPEPSRPLLPVM